nr:hypothetical protein [Mesorhizobium japonicum]
MPGVVSALSVAAGQAVKAGDQIDAKNLLLV